MKKLVYGVVLVVALSFIALPALAKITFQFQPGFTQSQFKDLSRDLGLATSYMPLAPAEPLGNKLPGVDIGVEATLIPIDKDASYWKNAVTNAGDLPDNLIFPKFHAQVGLPLIPIDLGFVYARDANSDIKYTGYEIKWAILRGGTVTPAIALRGAYTKLTGLDVLEIDTKSVDLSISKGFAIFTPYAGIGEVWISSKPTQAGLSLKKEDIAETKGFVGFKLSIIPPVVNIVAEGDFAKVNAYSLRLNLHF